MKKEFTFCSKDGKTPIHAVCWIPETDTQAPETDTVPPEAGGTQDGEFPSETIARADCRGILQLTHGMVEFIGRYEPFALYMASRGFLVVGNDNLGHGDSVLSRDDWGYFAPEKSGEILIEDMHQLRAMTQQARPDLPYFMLGHSMGSFLLRRYIAVHGESLAGAILVGTGFTKPAASLFGIGLTTALARVYGWRHRSSLVTAMTFRKNAGFDLTGENPEDSWLTKDMEIVKFYTNEPRCSFQFTLNGYRTLFETIRFVCAPKNAALVPKDLPILLVSGADDPVGEFGRGVRRTAAMYRRAGIRDVRMKLYENDRHEILNETDRKKVFRDLRRWIERHMEV